MQNMAYGALQGAVGVAKLILPTESYPSFDSKSAYMLSEESRLDGGSWALGKGPFISARVEIVWLHKIGYLRALSDNGIV